MKMAKQKNVLSNTFLVAITIYEETIVEHNSINFTKLVDKIPRLNADQVGVIIEYLEDKGIVYRSWKSIDGVWANYLYLDKRFIPEARGIYNCLKDEKKSKKVENTDGRNLNQTYYVQKTTKV